MTAPTPDTSAGPSSGDTFLTVVLVGIGLLAGVAVGISAAGAVSTGSFTPDLLLSLLAAVLLIVGGVMVLLHRLVGRLLLVAGALAVLIGGVLTLVSEGAGTGVVGIVLLVVLPIAYALLVLSPPVRRWTSHRR